MSYQKYWSLSKLPFGRPETADDFFSGRPQREAIARLDYLIRSGHSNGMVIAQSGVGRTSLLRRVASSAGFGDCAVEMVYTSAKDRDRNELLRQLAVKLGTQRLQTVGYRQVLERMSASGRSRVRTVWLIDDCTPAAATIASALTAECPWLTTILVCTSETALPIAANLGGCSLRVDIDPFELSDTVQFVRHQITAAGGSPAIYTDAAMVRLHELGQGLVAAIARLAELSLPVGAAQNATHIHVDVVEAVQHEIVYAAA
ncbi:AAA family ATPase [Planctomycetaceae bacterium SH139]